MKNLLATIVLGLILVTGATAQDTLKNDKPVKEKKINPKSNSKHNPNRKFGKERADEVKKRNTELREVKKTEADTAKTNNGKQKVKNKPEKQKGKDKNKDKGKAKGKDKSKEMRKE